MDFEIDGGLPGVHVRALVQTTGPTGVEMEALTVYDMLKAVEKSMVVTNLRLTLKDGGKSGRYVADERRTRRCDLPM